VREGELHSSHSSLTVSERYDFHDRKGALGQINVDDAERKGEREGRRHEANSTYQPLSRPTDYHRSCHTYRKNLSLLAQVPGVKLTYVAQIL